MVSRALHSAPSPSVEADVRLVAFDVDGTLVEHDRGLVVWQVLNRRFIGDSSINAERYQAFQRGEISYAEWVRLDIEGWRNGGATRANIEEAIRGELRLVPGAREVTCELARRGYHVVVVSGTIDILLHTLLPEHPFSHVFTSRIEFAADGAIQDWTATPYDMDGKADALRLLARTTGIDVRQFAFVGDHLNDCAALRLVGCPIAYDPKHEDVRASAKHVLPSGQLALLLDLFPGPSAPSP